LNLDHQFKSGSITTFVSLFLFRPYNIPAMLLEIQPMIRRQTGTLRLSAPYASAMRSLLIVAFGATLLIGPQSMQAQRGGGGGGGIGGGSIGSGAGRPGGVTEKDDLKNFHRSMAIQATPEQQAAFAKVAQFAQAAIVHSQAFRESLQKTPAPSPLPERVTDLDHAIENARASSKNFLNSLSSKQKSGLQDTTRKLEKADADLDRQVKQLDQAGQSSGPAGEQLSSSAAALDKALASFQSEQLALGREMSILFPTGGEGVTFILASVRNSLDVGSESITIPASGAVSRISAENGRNLFGLKLVADLSDVQQNITTLLRSVVNRSPACGQRIEILQATLTPISPAGLVVAKAHFERWVCPSGRGSAMEVASGDSDVQVKLTASIDAASGLQLLPEITRVEAQGQLRDSLRTGDLGVTLRDDIAAAILGALQKGTDVKTILPPVAQQSVTLQKAEFQDAGPDQMTLILDGQLQFSDEQTQQFAAQLKQPLAAQGPK
jgi:hypothetical protein